ncbi:RNA polymerase sigma factor [Nakamurella alba]|uniref:RNA polymerase sigma factor n=1 Tax=Nakamurella alba TaxID=2665158 RepID=UPI0018AA5FA0|nr:RNA polymerase sigma factor [Nakamurella alba]
MSELPGSFAAWVTPHLTVLAALGRRVVAAGDAEDVVQEALLRAWRRRSTFDPARGSARAWLVAILLDRARRHRVRSRPDQPFAGEEWTSPHENIAAGMDVGRAVDTLPLRQRQVVVLYYLVDLPVAEIAEVLGIGEGSVKSHLRDARAGLRTRLGTPDGES